MTLKWKTSENEMQGIWGFFFETC